MSRPKEKDRKESYKNHGKNPESLREKRREKHLQQRRDNRLKELSRKTNEARFKEDEESVEIAQAFKTKDEELFFEIFEGSKNNEELFENLTSYILSNFNRENINGLVSNENTLLTYAAVFNHYALAEFLITKMNASADVPDSNKNLPITLVFSNSFEDEDSLKCALLLLEKTTLSKELLDVIIDCVQTSMGEEYSEALTDFYEGKLNELFKKFNNGAELEPIEDEVENEEGLNDLEEALGSVFVFPPKIKALATVEESEEDLAAESEEASPRVGGASASNLSRLDLSKSMHGGSSGGRSNQ
jgi:hypothetical protein